MTTTTDNFLARIKIDDGLRYVALTEAEIINCLHGAIDDEFTLIYVTPEGVIEANDRLGGAERVQDILSRALHHGRAYLCYMLDHKALSPCLVASTDTAVLRAFPIVRAYARLRRLARKVVGDNANLRRLALELVETKGCYIRPGLVQDLADACSDEHLSQELVENYDIATSNTGKAFIPPAGSYRNTAILDPDWDDQIDEANP
jgi:hypothetical protein